MNNNEKENLRLWRNGYFMSLLLLFLLGVSFLFLGYAWLGSSTSEGQILGGIGIALGPAALIGALFRFFLFDEVKHEFTSPVLGEIIEKCRPAMQCIANEVSDHCKEQITSVVQLNQAGIIAACRSRSTAVNIFRRFVEDETKEIWVVGSSLKGLLHKPEYSEMADVLKSKASEGIVYFLMTHPAVADFRANQEARNSTEIGKEIVDSLRTLADWGVPESNVRLYKGTPTCFGIKTSVAMLLNPYPYAAVAYDSPSILLEAKEGNAGYYYDAFEHSHFRDPWDTMVAEKITDFSVAIETLNNKLITLVSG